MTRADIPPPHTKVGVSACVCVCVCEYVYIWIYIYIKFIFVFVFIFIFILYAALSNWRWKTEAQAIVLNPFTICSSYKWKFVICTFVDEETNGSYPFANGLNGLNGVNGLARWCIYANVQEALISAVTISLLDQRYRL